MALLTVKELDRIARERPCIGVQIPNTYSDLSSRLPIVTGEILQWFRDALADEERKWVAAAILETAPDSAKPLVRDLVAAGLKQLNPSFNRAFAIPLATVVSWPEIVNLMLEIASTGDDAVRGGVGRFSYWLTDEIPGFDASAYSRLNTWILEEFCRNNDLIVQRCLLPQLRLDESLVEEKARGKIPEVIEKARNSGDKYLNQRLDILLETHTGSFMPLDTSN